MRQDVSVSFLFLVRAVGALGRRRWVGTARQAEDVAKGSELFRMNCASCHNFTGRGGALSSGKYAPPLAPANEQEIYRKQRPGEQPTRELAQSLLDNSFFRAKRYDPACG